jgi:CubicO group peptidase (beta-lactamase class C family)
VSRRGWIALGAALTALLLCVVGARMLFGTRDATPRVSVAGGDAGGVPRAQPGDERIDGAALERAVQDPAAAQLAAFVVMRDEYLVFERYGHGYGADSVIDGGHFAEALLAMAAGAAAQQAALDPVALHGFDPVALRNAIEAATKQRYETFLSRKIWRSINAGPAWIELRASDAGTPADCCLHARVLDWMRVGALLVNDGRFEGKQVLPPGWVRRMQRPISLDSVRGFGLQLGPAAQGAEPFASAGVLFLRGPEHWRLWLLPSLKLAVLFGAAPTGSVPGAAAAAAMDETRLPNLVIRAVSDRPPQSNDLNDLQRLVPGH